MMFSVVGTWGYEVALIIFLWKPRLSVEVCVLLLEDISIREWTAWHFKVWLLKDISIRDWTTWKWQQVFKVWLLKHFSNRVVKHDIHFFIFGGSYISHPLGYILNNTPHLYIDFPSPFHSSLLVRRDTTAVGNLSGTFQKGLILNLASTAGSQRCWLNIHRYFHFSLSLFLYIYTYMVTTLRTEVNTIPQCPVTAPMSKSQGWTLDEHFSSNIYIYYVYI